MCFDDIIIKGAAAALHPNVGQVAQMNRNLDEIRRRNLLGRRGMDNKPPSAFRKPPVTKVGRLVFVELEYSSVSVFLATGYQPSG
jgi:hypothetical protein